VFSSQLHKHLIPAALPGGKFRIQYTVVTGLPTGKGNEFHALFSIQDVTSLSAAIDNYNLTHRELLTEMAERHRAETELQKTAAELKRLNQVLKDKSIRDGLTGLYNHRYFWQVMRRDFSLANRHGTGLSCLLIDLDYFKKINDTYGHLFGDTVLRGIGKKIQQHVRQTDVASRYGGEEFAVILPSTNLEGAMVIAETIRKTIEKTALRKGSETVRVTASIGVSSLKEHRADTPEKLLDFADTALYDAKNRGRNRIACYPENTL
jgi:diguanylate cyclase (GGDEF)-like protein